MKLRRILTSLFLVCIAGYVCFAIIYETKRQAEQRRRGELFMLDLVGVGVSIQLGNRGELPTNWLSLSNSVNWELVNKKAQYSLRSPVTEVYSVISRPTVFTNYSIQGRIFFVRSKSCAWPGKGFGRWALVASSNQVFRTWFSEDYLPLEIRSQLTNQPK